MSQPINDGGPAFPHTTQWDGINSSKNHTGMTLRDYFAAAALTGFWAVIRPDQVWSNVDVATTCYRMADAMLKAKEAKP